MIIKLERILAPEDTGVERCAICAETFEQGVVYAYATTDERTEIGEVCPTCVEYMGGHPSGRFPTIEEYRQLEAEWLTPAYSSGEEADRAEGHIE
jgi:hypothetical protein